jgi:hypothetical protein
LEFVLSGVCRPGYLRTVSRETARYKLDLVGVQVRWDKGGTEPADDYTFFSGNGNADYHLGTGCFEHKGIVSAVKREEFVSDTMSYIILRWHSCVINVLSVDAPTEDKCDRTAFVRN